MEDSMQEELRRFQEGMDRIAEALKELDRHIGERLQEISDRIKDLDETIFAAEDWEEGEKPSATTQCFSLLPKDLF